MQKWILATLASACALLLAVGPSTASAHQAGRSVDSVGWKSCPEAPADPNLRCATLHLPVDWARPHGPTFPLAIAKRAATDPRAKIGPLLVHPGGPGLSGVKFVRDAATKLGPDLLRRFDVIGFDPRGVVGSDPIVCSAALLAQQPFPIPANQNDFNHLVAYNQKVFADCRQRTGTLFDHVDTVSVAKDVDAIRTAIGAPTLSFYVQSYGTMLGHQYAERFPNRIRAMVTDGNMDHSLSTAEFIRSEAAAVEDSFEQFVAWCDRSETCALHGEKVSATYDELMHRARTGSLSDPATGAPLSWIDLSDRTLNAFYGPDWPTFATWLAELDQSTNNQPTRTPPPARPEPPAATTAADVRPNPILLACQDWSLPVRDHAQFAQYLALSEKAAPHVRISTLAMGVVISCLGWDRRVNNPQHTLRVHTSVPILVANSLHDPGTPHTWATTITRQLERDARLVTYEGAGHTTYQRTTCINNYIKKYLLNLTLPRRNATCPAE